MGLEFTGARDGFLARNAFLKCDSGYRQKLADQFARAGVIVNNQ